ncbi:MAG TPA: hypothetical protein PK566_15380 [Pseudobacteroides sp.]|nr:hypothetical protein [Pseudobacteroides sp.]
MTEANLFIHADGSIDGDNETVTNQKSAIKKFHITLFEGTDSIKFGMTSEEIQDILKIKPTYFKQSQVDLFETEDYYRTCHISYTLENDKLTCAAIAFLPSTEVFLDNYQIMGKHLKKVEPFFKERFDDYTGDGYGGLAIKHGITFSTNTPKKVNWVYIFKKGYWEEQEEFYKNNSINIVPIEGTMRTVEFLLCKHKMSSDQTFPKCPKCGGFMVTMI